MTRSIRSRALMGAAVAALAPAALVATSAFAPAFAQDFTSGGLAGDVTDASGAAVGGASVTLTSNAQGFTRTTTSNSNGAFRFSALPQGSYTVTVTSSAGTSTLDNVRIIAGTSTDYTFVVGAVGDEIVVSGTRQNLDFANTTVGVNIDLEELVKTIPIGRNITAVTLLAPGTVLGDSAFSTAANGGQNLAAIGGSSVAENVYYINGLNITNFDNGLGGSVVPFDFYKSVEVKTGGYPAEFGRATGGIVNAVTKSGTNEWKAAVHLNWSPDELRSDSPDTIANANRADQREDFDAIVEIGGPIIKDRLFVYGLVQLNDDTSVNASNAKSTTDGDDFALVDKGDDPFWGLKVDGYITDEHHLEFTYFDTSRKLTREVVPFDSINDNDVETGFGLPTSTTLFRNGGESFVAKYTGAFTDWLTVSGAYGQNDDRGEQLPGSGQARALDLRTGIAGELSPNTTTSVTLPRTTEREFIRADIDILFSAFGDHHLRVGFDKENLDFARSTIRNGPNGYYYIYRNASGTDLRLGGTSSLSVGDDYVELNLFDSGGAFRSENIAYYIQDEWDVTDRLTLNLGVRLDQFNNFTADGSQFIDFNKEFGPRAGFSYDVFGDGRGKFFGNYGVYYLPVASNTAFRQGAREFFFREYWNFAPGSIDGNGVPILTTQITGFPSDQACPFGLTPASSGAGCVVTGDGAVQDPTASIAANLEATKETEILVGYEQQVSDLWTLGVTYLRRRLNATAEDAAVDDYINAYCDDAANGVDQSVTDCSSIWSGFHQYTILNPGKDSLITFSELLPGETSLRTVLFTADQLGFPKAERKYDSIQFSFNRAFDGVWSLRGSYTWSNSRGNTEGYVQSDFGQTDAGITQDFDKTGFTDFAFGKLPNHRSHEFKVWGGYQVTEEFSLGANVIVQSPRQFSCFGLHPDAVGVGAFDPSLRSPNGPGIGLNFYGAASHFCNPTGIPGDSVAVPRGTGPSGDWLANVDMSARYDLELPTGTVMTLRADVFNVFNFDGVASVDEFGETGGGTPRPAFGTPLTYQQPRSVRLGLDINF